MTMLTFAAVSAVLVAVCSADQAPPGFGSSQFVSAPFAAVHQPGRTAHVPVLSRTDERHDDGHFSSNYQTGDGQTFQESGATKRNFQNDGDVIVKQGSYSFTSPEGIHYTVQYTADEFGFHPVASHIPVSVTVPPVRF